MSTTSTKWQCPECKGHWPAEHDYCHFCKVIYGQYIPRDGQR